MPSSGTILVITVGKLIEASRKQKKLPRSLLKDQNCVSSRRNAARTLIRGVSQEMKNNLGKSF